MKKDILRKGIAIVLFSVLIGTIGVPFPYSVYNHNVLADNQDNTCKSMSYTFSFIAPDINTRQIADTTYCDIHMTGCIGRGEHPGEPIIPVKYVNLLLPPYRSVETVTVTGTPIEIPTTGNQFIYSPVFPSQNQRPIGGGSYQLIL